jgi:large subunit ribosomal protein L47
MSRLPRLLRLMHTTNRQIPNPGQGGAPPTPSISPSTHEHHHAPRPQTDHLGPDPTHVLDPTGHDVSPSPSGSSSTLAALHAAKFTPKGKAIPTRPARTTPVSLPSGEPEPKTYPPGDEYFAGLTERKQRQHPLWQFFHVPSEAKATLDAKASGPPQNMGSLELLGDDDDNIKSGESIRSPGCQGKVANGSSERLRIPVDAL